MINKKRSSIIFLIIIFLLALVLIIRLIDQSQMVSMFPLDGINDMSSYMAQLHFLKECGFHEQCPYWYNGFVTFVTTPPGWYFFTLPLYLLLNNVQLASYVSLILMYIISFLALKSITKSENLSRNKGFLLFLLFFANAIAIGNFIRMGRFVSIFGFMSIFLLAAMLYYYKSKKLDNKFLWFIPIYFILILSHLQEMVLGHILLLGFLLVKNNKERIRTIVYGLITWILASFWYAPFLRHLVSSTLVQDSEGINYWWTNLTGINPLTNLIAIILPITLIIMFYLYFKQNKNKKERLFYYPVILFSLLFLTRITAFIPIINNISIDPIILFLLFFIILMFFKIDFEKYGIKKLAHGLLLALVILSSFISLFITPYFEGHNEIDNDSIVLLKIAEDNLLVLSKDDLISVNSYNSFIPIRFGISVLGGWYPYLSTPEYLDKVSKVSMDLNSGECSELAEELKVNNILTYDDNCDTLSRCNYDLVGERGRVCLFSVN